MSDPDDFQTEGDSTVGAVTTKYYQVSVPDYPLVGAAAGGTATGSSFVCLGSFPTGFSSDSQQPAGFASSLTLANLVGKASAISSAETGIDTVPSGFSDGSGLPSPYDGKGDPNFLLGFADDTRRRAGDASNDTLSNANTLSQGSSVTNTGANRQLETARLLTKGGWWDHSDGNRVTTTVGDKIEVIQGNYKLVVLGRQPLPASTDSTFATVAGNSFITDVSGGHFQEQYPSPTPCIKTIEYSLDQGSGEWTLYQDNGLGNLITKLQGRTVDLFQGSSRETYVGLNPGTTPLANADVPPGKVTDPFIASYTWAQSVYSQTGSEAKPIGGGTAGVNANPSTSTGPQPSGVSNGDVISKTWATRVQSYVGSVSTPVAHIFSLTFADEIESYTFALSHVNTTMGMSAVSINGVLNTLEVVMGFKESIQIGASINLKLAAELTMGLTRTSFYGESTSLEGGKVVVNASKSELNAVDSRVSNTRNILATTCNLLSDENLSVAMQHELFGASVSLGA